ncbi:MAG: nodulation protein NfeD [Anaerolineaceae bacterium]
MKTKLPATIFVVLILVSVWLPVVSVKAQTGGSTITIQLTANGAVTPAMADYLDRGLKTAADRQAALVILVLNTPGGSIEVMNRMVEMIRASSIPVIVYVSPDGAIAGSAGTVITLAGHLSGMAPETAIGAASPVDYEGGDIDQTMSDKIKEILKATTRSLTERRGSQAMQLADEAVEDARAVSASEALKAGLIDFIARDTTDLLRQADGKKILINGKERTLETRFLQVEPLPTTLVEQGLQMATNPNLVFLLLNIGVMAVLIELSSPGGWVAGFLGVVFIALAVYGLGILPVNLFGLVFMVLAFVLFALEVKAPTHGALTTAGTVSLIAGALVLFNSPGVPAFQRVSVPLVIGTGIIIALSFFFLVSLGLTARKLPVSTGFERLAGMTGFARSDINPSGSVHAAGEIWSADLGEGQPPIHDGEQVRIERVEGLRLKVKKM